MTVLLRQTGGGFAPDAGSPYPVPGPAQLCRDGDFNGDGRPDVAAKQWDGATVTVLVRQGGGGIALEHRSAFRTDTRNVGSRILLGSFRRTGGSVLGFFDIDGDAVGRPGRHERPRRPHRVTTHLTLPPWTVGSRAARP